MKILVVYPYFVDGAAPGHSVMFDTLTGLVAAGHSVTVVSGESGYMQGQAQVLRRPWWQRLVYTEQIGGIRVLRTLSYTGHQKSLGARFLSYALLSALNPIAVLLAPRPDVALLSPPPLYPIFTSLLACMLRRLPVVAEVRDLWPGSIVQMGLMKNPALIRLTAWMERVLYDRAKAIIGLTEGITDDIVGRGWPAARVQTLPCAVDTTAFVPDDRLREQVRRQHGWADKFVVLYFGALGEANNLAVLVRAAQSMRGQLNVVFAVVGDGFRRPWLEAQVRELGLANLRVLPAVPKGDAPAYLNAADACVVTLQDIPVFAGAIPTKLIEYMACGKPVLCGVRGEARRIVEAAGAGMCFEPDDHTALAAGALALRESPEEARASGNRGQAHARSHFDQVGRVKRMAEVLRSAFTSA